MSDLGNPQEVIETQLPASEPAGIAPVETTHAPATAPQSAPDILSLARERGYRFESQEEVLEAIDRLADNVNRLSPYADFGKNAVPHWNEFEAWRKEQAAKASTPEAPKRGPWAPPSLDQLTLDTYFTKDSVGRYTPKPGIPDEVARQAAEWDAYTMRHLYKFRTDPLNALNELGYAPKEQIINEVKEYLRSESERNSYEYEKNAVFDSLKPKIMDSNGRLNAYGARLAEVVDQLEKEGIRKPTRVAQLAQQLVDAEFALTKQSTEVKDAAIRAQAGLPQNPGGPAASNPGSRVAPAVRPEAIPPNGFSFHQMLMQQDPNFDFNSMRKELLK